MVKQNPALSEGKLMRATHLVLFYHLYLVYFCYQISCFLRRREKMTQEYYANHVTLGRNAKAIVITVSVKKQKTKITLFAAVLAHS